MLLLLSFDGDEEDNNSISADGGKTQSLLILLENGVDVFAAAAVDVVVAVNADNCLN